MDSNTQPQYSENNNQVWECLPTSSNYVDQIAFSPDGKILASYHNRSTETIKLWNVTTGQQLYTANFADLREVDRAMDFLSCKSLFFSPNGNNLACIGFIWDLVLGKAVSVKALQSPFKDYQWENVALSPDLKIAVSTDKDSGIIKLWETSTGKEIHTLSVGDNAWDIYINQFSPDGKIFASLTWLDPYVVEKTETIKLWEVETGKELCSILVPRVTAYSKYTGVIALSSDGQILASNSQDNNSGHYDQKTVIVLSETLTGKEICRFPKFLEWEEFVAKKLAEEESVEKKSVGLKKFISSAFNKFLLIKFLLIFMYKYLLKSLELDREFSLIKPEKVVSLAFSPNDQLLASGDNDGTITLWQLKKGSSELPTTIQTFTSFFKQPIKTLAFSPDGQTLATGHGDNDGGITLWDVNSGKKIKTFAGHVVSAARLCCNGFIDRNEVAISPDGKMITSSGYKDMIRLWHTQTGSFLRSFESKSHPRSAKKITFSRDGKFLVSVYRYRRDRDIVLWEVSTGREIQTMIPVADNSYSRHWSSRYLNQYGDLLAISEKSTSFDGAKLQIKVLQVPNGQTVCTLIGNYQFPSQIIFSPDKRLVATRHNMSEFGIWELATGRLIRNINTDYAEGDTDPGDPDPVLFSPDGKILAIAGTANITLWQVSSGEKIQTINRYHQGWGSCLAFHPNGQILAFSGSDSTDSIKLWDIKTGSEICILQETLNRVTSLDFSGNGEVLVSSYRDGTISVWQQKRV